MSTDDIVITGFTRTPHGAFQGQFSQVTTPELGAASIQGLLEKTQISSEAIDEVIMGCVLSAGLGQAPARQAGLKAGLPQSTGATTINKMCGSGMQATILGRDAILSGRANCVIAGGMENMTRSPYLLPQARTGYRMGHQRALDHMFLDGLEDAYETGTLMGVFADRTAAHYQISREAQDEFALSSLEKAKAAHDDQSFQGEMIAVEVQQKGSTTLLSDDEPLLMAKPDKIPQLKPAFGADGTVTAANASSISDGAASLLLMSKNAASLHHCQPLATIKGVSSYAAEPEWFTTAPIGAIKHLLKTLDWSIHDVDLFEINEAFAVVTLAAIQELKLPTEKVNIYGGACAIGHPIGASGSRIIGTLLNALIQTNQQRGIAALCIGGGEATAIAIERTL